MITPEQYTQVLETMCEKDLTRLTAAVNELAFFHLIQIEPVVKEKADLSMANLPALLKVLVTQIEAKQGNVPKSIEQCKQNIQNFADKHGLIFKEDAEVGFSRECVGLIKGNGFVDYNPTDYVNYDIIQELYDERFNEIAPPDAYHKHSCIAVLGKGDEAIRQLSDWIDQFNKIGVEVKEYSTGAKGVQALLSGAIGYTICSIKNG